MGERFWSSVAEPGAVRGASPLVAWARFWMQCWRFSGRASRSEFWWCVAAEAVVAVALGVAVPSWLGLEGRWTLFADPFGVVPTPSVQFGPVGDGWSFGQGDRSVTPNAYDVVVLAWMALTALPRLTLLVRRLHDRDRSGFWCIALVVLGPIGWLIVTLMVVGQPKPGGERFDAGLWTGRPPRALRPDVER